VLNASRERVGTRSCAASTACLKQVYIAVSRVAGCAAVPSTYCFSLDAAPDLSTASVRHSCNLGLAA
jgi:hypothetical protein